MKRSTLMIITGIIFILAGIAVIIIAAIIGDELVPLLSVASAVLFTGVMVLFSGIDEKRLGKEEEKVKVQADLGKLVIAAPFGKRYALPIFIILFGTVVLAIAAGILYLAGNEEAGYVLFGINGFYGLVLNIYFIIKLSRHKNKQKTDQQMDELAFKVVFFFATLATGGLFAIGYLLYKKLKK